MKIWDLLIFELEKSQSGSPLPLFDNLVLVACVAFSAQAIDLLFCAKYCLTRAMLHKNLYVYKCTDSMYIDCV